MSSYLFIGLPIIALSEMVQSLDGFYLFIGLPIIAPSKTVPQLLDGEFLFIYWISHHRSVSITFHWWVLIYLLHFRMRDRATRGEFLFIQWVSDYRTSQMVWWLGQPFSMVSPYLFIGLQITAPSQMVWWLGKPFSMGISDLFSVPSQRWVLIYTPPQTVRWLG